MNRRFATARSWAGQGVVALRLAWTAGRLAAAGTVALALGSGIAPVWGIWSTRGLIDALAQGQPRAAVTHGVALLGSVALTAVIPLLTKVLVQELRRRIELHMQDRLFGAVAGLPDLATFESAAFHDKLHLAQSASFGAPAQVLTGGVSLLRSAVTVVGFGATLAILDPGFAVIAYVAALPVLISELRLAKRRMDLVESLSQRERRRMFYATLMSDPRAVKETRLFGAADYLRRKLSHEYGEIARRERAVDLRELATQSALVLLSLSLTAAAVVMCVQGARAGRLTIGDVAAVLATLTAIQATTANLVREIGSGYQSLAGIRHYTDLTAAPTAPAAAPIPAPPLRHGIELHDVWFRYGDDKPWVLAGLSLFIPAHRELAIVGLNGSGKSTLIKIICGLYQPVRGTLTWDGVDYRNLDPASLHRRISTVFQDYMEYDLSASENISIADTAAVDSLPRIRAAARVAGLDDTFTGMPSGYGTIISRKFDSMPSSMEGIGDTTFLSGGQWQRVAIARAALRAGSDLMILDEPSAALDPEAEAEIQRRIRRVRHGTTSILISHRLNTVRGADTILVLEHGRLIETGTHDELMERAGRYGQLFAIQATNYQDQRIGAAS